MIETEQLTIMFTDIGGFTSKTSAKSRAELNDFLEIHDGLIVPIFEEFGGRIIKTIGDAFLTVFKSPTDAVLCGIEIQRTLKRHNANSREDQRLEVRVAINSGEVTLRDNDVFGEPVNIAARIEGIAGVNEIYFTEAVYLAMNKNEIPTAEIGYRKLKGIPHEIKVFKVLAEGEKGATVKTEHQVLEKSPEKPLVSNFTTRKTFYVQRVIDLVKNLLLIFLILILILIVSNFLEKKGGFKGLQRDLNQFLKNVNKL
jgi:class 3 adenylate cyclase